MAIEKKLIHFGKLADFEAQLTAGNILDYSIVFIQDAKKIWTHGTYYDCSEGTATGDEFWYVDDTNGKLTTDYDTEVLADLTAGRLVTSSIAAYDGNEYTTGEQGQVLTADGDGNMHWGDLSIPTKVSELENDKEYLDKTIADESYTKSETFESSTYAKANGLADYYRAYALPTSVNGDEDDVILTLGTVKTINGESIFGSGDITIQGGESYDDSEIREAISQLSALTDDFNSDIANLYNIKQDTLVSGTNIKTINGESILGEGDLTIEGGAKVYTWNWDGSDSGTLSQEEYDGIIGADIVYIAGMGGAPTQATMSKDGDYRSIIFSQIVPQESGTIAAISFIFEINEDKSYNSNVNFAFIPTKNSQLENDSNFVTSDGLKTINGESILGSGNITISGGVSQDYVDNAIANAITTTLNTAV